jgi:hypothetical protein
VAAWLHVVLEVPALRWGRELARRATLGRRTATGQAVG